MIILKIRSMALFDNYKTYINSVLQPGTNYEVEVRFTEFTQKRGVSLRTFNRLSEIYGQLSSTVTNQVDYLALGIRKSVIGRDVEYMSKISKWQGPPRVISDYGLKFDINTEEIISPDDDRIRTFEQNTGDKVIRNKNRKSYELDGGTVRLDLTKVTMTDESKYEYLNYEVELELIKGDGLDSWFSNINKILGEIQDTEVLYNRNEFLNVVKYVNAKLTGSNSDDDRVIKTNIVVQAKNLKFYHMTDNYFFGDVSHKITIKTDGIRKLLIYYLKSFYLVMYPSEINKLVSYNSEIFNGKLDGMILEGEMVPISRRRSPAKEEGLTTSSVPIINTKYFYLIYDTLSTTSSVPPVPSAPLAPSVPSVDDPRNLSHTQRLVASRILADEFKTVTGTGQDTAIGNLITIQVKDFRLFKSSEEFFMTVNALEEVKLTQPYYDDGYIIMPDNISYLNLGRAKGSRTLDILKWKPIDKLTIDLAIVPTPQREVVVYTNTYNAPFLEIYKDVHGINIRSSVIKPSIVAAMVPYNNKQYRVIYPSFIDIVKSDIRLINRLFTRSSVVKFESLPGTKTYIMKETDLKPQPLRSILSVISKLAKFGTPGSFITTVNLKFSTSHEGAGGTGETDAYMELIASMQSTQFNKKVLTKGLIDISDLPAFTIVEFSWNPELQALSPDRVRSDKDIPNETKVAEDVWNMIEDPIELRTMIGETLQLMRKYHNQIKRRLLRGKVKGIFPKFGKLLDIGSGVGGDVDKWSDYNKIIAVEPWEPYIIELKNRINRRYGFVPVVIKSSDEIQKINKEDKIVVINAGGEQVDLINQVISYFLNDKVDVITSMLSLSFFWKGNMLDALIRLISTSLRSGGTFMYLTIDGDLVTQYFDPVVRGPVIEGPLNLLNGEASILYNGQDKTLYIDLPRSETVKTQTEPLVFLDDLRFKLKDFGELSWYIADQESFMNSSERVISSLYSYGGFSKY